MNSKPNNPQDNQLKAPYTEEGLRTAIDKSGYPLQSVIATLLQPNFSIQEEWSYLDKDSQEPRSLDIRADKPLHETDTNGLTVLPRLSLVIECKHSEHPHLLFQNVTRPDVSSFPLIAGLPRDPMLLILDNEGNESQEVPIRTALDLFGHRFITQEVNYSFTVSRGTLQGKDRIELSGNDFFNSLVLPLVKAATYLKQSLAPEKDLKYSAYSCTLVIPVAVIDGPLVAVDLSAGTQLSLSPWERLVRHEAASGTFAVDVVHKTFFYEYVHSFVLPFAYDFARRVLAHQKELFSGQGHLRPLPPAPGQPSLGYEPHTVFESRIEPF